MARIYVASSWRNKNQQKLISLLRDNGHKVYDFTKPHGEDKPNVWDEVQLNQDRCSAAQYSEAMSNPVVEKRFEEHLSAMTAADTCILLLPCGFSAHSEAGFMAGLGKRVFVFNFDKEVKPELMYLLYEGYANDPNDLLEWLEDPVPGVCRVCGCTEDNPCFNPKHGYCSWTDSTMTLCSHCANKEIADDPETIHCVNDNDDVFR